MKKYFKLSVLIMLTIGLILGSFSISFAQKKEVAVLLPGTVEFFSVMRQGIDKAALDFGLNITYADAEWDAGKQLSQVENFIVKKVDAIMLCAADNMALLPAVKLCNDANIPLISFTNSLGTDPEGKYAGVVSYIGRSEIGAGIIQGEMAELLLGDKEASIVLIEGNPGTAPQRMREEGFLKIAAKHPNWTIVEKRPIEGWTKEGALAFMEAFLQSGRKVDLVSCQWWSGAIAAAMALEEAGVIGVYVTGLEYAKELVPYIKEGRVTASTYFSVVEEGYKAVETTSKYLNGETVPTFVEIKHIIVTKDNVEKFVPEM
ncbi:LacI family transcriptional regulator [Candidatus Atribacteria bacterium RBG_19FT_COMBO_35_14]|uniref:LacI family transcriptional regulator n=1 Tax=Candidatus Sediminicultor quintus TaxID=1797291 RepID=A0A1F5AF24_9BACT|nr:MAG: LacI family transcriptional regulator [Candidatus Atribacteria bacterium RBG_19FT_COMBO_35_14]